MTKYIIIYQTRYGACYEQYAHVVMAMRRKASLEAKGYEVKLRRTVIV